MEREKIKLSNDQWQYLVHENYLTDEFSREVEIKEIQRNYDGSRRHTEDHHLIFQRVSDGKYFRIDYETSVKDEMGWTECNSGSTHAIEVFPETQITITYN